MVFPAIQGFEPALMPLWGDAQALFEKREICIFSHPCGRLSISGPGFFINHRTNTYPTAYRLMSQLCPLKNLIFHKYHRGHGHRAI